MIWHSTCAICGERVTGGSDNGTLDLPVGGETVVCLTCVAFGEAADWPRVREAALEAFSGWGADLLVKSELAEA